MKDIVIIGGGPAGLSAALQLGRARKSVLLCDGGPRRNASAEHIHNFVTRDGTPPAEFRRIGRDQLAPYRSVDIADEPVTDIRGSRGAFEVSLGGGRPVTARRVLLSTGMIDRLPDIEGYRALWGKSIFICPYCHAWEVQDRRFAFLAPSVEKLDFALLLLSWTSDLVVLTDGRFEVPPETLQRFARAGIAVDGRRIVRLREREGQLAAVEFDRGEALPVDILFARPPQRQVALVESLGLSLDPEGYVRVDERRETSIPGIYAAGDLVTPFQGAMLAAALGVQAAGSLNLELTIEMATSGAMRPASSREPAGTS